MKTFLFLIFVSSYAFASADSGAVEYELRFEISKLQDSVKDLQRQIQDLKSENESLKLRVQASKFVCEVSAFGKAYKAFGLTKSETSEKATHDCSKENNRMHCEKVKCDSIE